MFYETSILDGVLHAEVGEGVLLIYVAIVFVI